jgi:ubiquitin carboxyl-terminal hydrolase L3
LIGEQIPLEHDKFLSLFRERTLGMNHIDRGHELEYGEALAHLIKEAHHAAASEGQTEQIMDVMTHFVAIVPIEGRIIELDGRKQFPVDHGPFQGPDTFVQEATQRVVREEFMDKDPEELRFSMLALARPDVWD